MPVIGTALRAGRIGVSQILELARIQANLRTRAFFERVAPIYLERAEHHSVDDLRSDVESFINLADQDGAFAELHCHVEQRTATLNVVDGTLIDSQIRPLIAAGFTVVNAVPPAT